MYQNRPKNIIAGWTAIGAGQEMGKKVEYEVEEFVTQKGQKFSSFSLYKPYLSRRPESLGQWKRSFSFPTKSHAEIVERINHMIRTMGLAQGQYEFKADPAIAAVTPQVPMQLPPQYGLAQAQQQAGQIMQSMNPQVQAQQLQAPQYPPVAAPQVQGYVQQQPANVVTPPNGFGFNPNQMGPGGNSHW